MVRVVVSEWSEWFGEENVLLTAAPSIELTAPPVLVVKALDWPASELIVSGLVSTVGAVDLLLYVAASLTKSLAETEGALRELVREKPADA